MQCNHAEGTNQHQGWRIEGLHLCRPGKRDEMPIGVMGISLVLLQFFLFFRLFTIPNGGVVGTFVPLFERRWNTVFPVSAPRPMTAVMMSPAPARTPEGKAEGSKRNEEQEQRQERTKAAEAETKSPWMERHSISIIGVRCGRSLTRGCLDRHR